MIEKISEWLQLSMTTLPSLLLALVMFFTVSVIVLLATHALYMRILFKNFRNMIYLDLVDLMIDRNKKKHGIEDDLNNRLERLQTTNFAPRLSSSSSYIKLVPKSKKEDTK